MLVRGIGVIPLTNIPLTLRLSRLKIKICRHGANLPMNPNYLLTPALSSFLGRRGRRSLGRCTVPVFNARSGLRGILSPVLFSFFRQKKSEKDLGNRPFSDLCRY